MKVPDERVVITVTGGQIRRSGALLLTIYPNCGGYASGKLLISREKNHLNVSMRKHGNVSGSRGDPPG